MDVGETVVAALETVRQALVFEAEEVQEGGVDIVDVGPVRDGVETEFVGLADDLSTADSTTSKPHGEGINVMVATGPLAGFAHGRATEFAAPDDDGGVEESVGLEVAHERGAALVGLVTTLGKIVFEGFAGTAVGIPVGVVKLDEAYAPFDEATR